LVVVGRPRPEAQAAGAFPPLLDRAKGIVALSARGAPFRPRQRAVPRTACLRGCCPTRITRGLGSKGNPRRAFASQGVRRRGAASAEPRSIRRIADLRLALIRKPRSKSAPDSGALPWVNASAWTAAPRAYRALGRRSRGVEALLTPRRLEKRICGSRRPRQEPPEPVKISNRRAEPQEGAIACLLAYAGRQKP
jgi:hypothetical protein